jgi:non-ribosomal peptide synthase protein (TIGR01720 family)
LKNLAYPEVFFNYVSRVDAMLPEGLPFLPLPVPPGIHYSDPQNDLIYRLYMEAGIYQERLAIDLTYSRRMFSSVTIERFVGSFKERLHHLAG